jgi:hypothetical protein
MDLKYIISMVILGVSKSTSVWIGLNDVNVSNVVLIYGV